jgi:DNA-binding transcriptional regulator LsrR (DeoR family)
MRRRLEEAREQLEASQRTREEACAAAFASGASLNEIAEAVGMSHQGVSKMLARLGVRERWLSVEDANRELRRLAELREELRRRGELE